MQSLKVTTSLCVLAMAATVAQAQAPQSASVLEFAGEDVLFVADSAGSAIHAYELAGDFAAPEKPAPYNLLNLDGILAEALGADLHRITYHDLAVHPISRDAYVSLSAFIDDAEQAVVVSVARDGAVSRLDLAGLPSDTFAIEDPADASVTFWRDIPAATFTVTDLDFVDGELFVSGLSTGEFASTLRRVPYPFSDAATSTGIEIYHAAHNQSETRAPIRAMTVVDLEGTPTVVAAYTCTPLVTVPVTDLKDGANVTGKTIAELGYGNTPLEVLDFSISDMAGNSQDVVLVINREMDADLITMNDLTAAAQAPGITTPVAYLGDTKGVSTTSYPLSGVYQAADQDAQFLVTLRRNIDTGNMDLVSFRKGVYLRLSEFVSEYNFPDYEYADAEFAQQTKMFQNMLKADEGFPDQMR
ncbi:MAG: hypothetical protein AAGF74_06885 [Pseudomonadota bacterium]